MESSGTTFPFYLSIRIPGVDEYSNYKPVEPSLSNGGSPVIKTELPTSTSSSGLRQRVKYYPSNAYFIGQILWIIPDIINTHKLYAEYILYIQAQFLIKNVGASVDEIKKFQCITHPLIM